MSLVGLSMAQFGTQTFQFVFVGDIRFLKLLHQVGVRDQFQVLNDAALRVLGAADHVLDAAHVAMTVLLRTGDRLFPCRLVDGRRLQPFQQQSVDGSVNEGSHHEPDALGILAEQGVGVAPRFHLPVGGQAAQRDVRRIGRVDRSGVSRW